MKKNFSEIVFVFVIFIVIIVLFLVTPVEVLNTIIEYLVIGLGGLCLLGLLVAGYFLLDITRTHLASQKRPNFFEEMQSVLSTTLLPLGFEEREGPSGRVQSVRYSRDELSVDLTLDIMDSLYYLSGTGKSDFENPASDFSIEGHITQADTFKSDSISKLDEWLVEQRVS